MPQTFLDVWNCHIERSQDSLLGAFPSPKPKSLEGIIWKMDPSLVFTNLVPKQIFRTVNMEREAVI